MPIDKKRGHVPEAWKGRPPTGNDDERHQGGSETAIRRRQTHGCGQNLICILFCCIAFSMDMPGSHGFHLTSVQQPVTCRPLLPSFHWQHNNNCRSRKRRLGTSSLYGKAAKVSHRPWYPLLGVDEEERANVEREAVELCRSLIRRRIDGDTELAVHDDSVASRQHLVHGRFRDLACTEEGEAALEALFDDSIVNGVDEGVIRASVMVMQSLCVFGTQVGVKGTPEQLRKMVAHLDPRGDPSLMNRDVTHWDADSVRRLKHRLDYEPAVQLLASLQWKRTTQGAFDLLNTLNAWSLHEDLALLRSGFPLRFSEAEVQSACEAIESKRDPDELLGIRKDLRHLKVYTIDGASASEIDDGLSIERVKASDGSTIHRIWIHIADAERWAPRSSEPFRTAQQRITSLYLPRTKVPMFPQELTDTMSLQTGLDCSALSLTATINEDGSVDKTSIAVVPSTIRVTYRLTYDDVDEMLEEGTGYREEWELGVLLDIARKRREYRIRRGSSESLIPNPIPYAVVSTFEESSAPDGIGIKVRVEVSHNAGQNQTQAVENDLNGQNSIDTPAIVPVSSSFLLVTEAMILAGEAVGHWKIRRDREDSAGSDKHNVSIANRIRLPFRTQPAPDFRSRARERRVMEDLRDSDAGSGYCYAWYARRFLLPVKISEYSYPHSGLGLDCYVQWTSPIRRFADLQTHVSVKRCLRRDRLSEILGAGETIPSSLLPVDFGLPMDSWPDDLSPLYDLSTDDLDEDLDFLRGVGLVGAARTLQRQSQQYWLFEFLKREMETQPEREYIAIVLGCVDPERQQYAIYLPALGLEHKYLSQCRLDPGVRLRLSVDSVSPRLGLLSFVRFV